MKQEIPSKDVFCNSPWYELHIYWDGSYGYCCGQTPYHPYDDKFSEYYNVKEMTIKEWHNSIPMRQARVGMQTPDKLVECGTCWHQEKYSDTSRRIKANQKSVIFTKHLFDESYKQSPNYKTFEYSFRNMGYTKMLPVDLHIDLGNYCNLACKFCRPEASSTIASQYLKWGVLHNRDLLGNDWTKNNEVWNSIITQILKIPNLINIHVMGGETLITSRFEELVDKFIEYERYDVSFSFVTNGTTFNELLLNKLTKFKRVGIEVSIETLTRHNEYIRQGTDNSLVIGNIFKYMNISNDTSINITIRPAFSLLSIGYYYTLIDFCIKHKLLIKSIPVRDPECLDVRLLPKEIRESYKKNYIDLFDKLTFTEETVQDYNESNPSNYEHIIKSEIEKCIVLLDLDDIQHDSFPDLLELLTKWDKIYDLNARDLYPEFIPILDEYGYNN